ncbi:MAG TPA: hypothetical protein VHB97_11870 [Polyangia bacterium]|nr:hypothetical protein [Polyangia bacterium]
MALLPLVGMTGCKRQDRQIIGEAHAASSWGAGRAAEAAAARVVMGDDDDGTTSNAGGGGRHQGYNNKWKDTTVYVDGKPTGVLGFGELPAGLKPVWVDEQHSAEIEPGSHSPGFITVKSRRYRFIDLLRAYGVDVKRINQIHLMGPKTSEVIIASGAELRSKNGQNFMFRFGSNVGGKAIPVVPPNFGNHYMPDKIAVVMVYIDKKPPELVQGEGLYLDGKPVDGVAYFGEPIRGGIRIYADDKLAVQVKQVVLRSLKPVQTDAHGLNRYALLPLLESRGVDTSKLVDGFIIADEEWKRRLTRAELERATVAMGDRHVNEVAIDGEKFNAQAVAVLSHHLSDAELPHIRPDERD